MAANMRGNGGNNNHHPNNNVQPEGGEREEEEFGEFEGFEAAAMEPIQAQAAPSPWVTFPDLLPVQTSPATSAEESHVQQGRVSDNPDVNHWWGREGDRGGGNIQSMRNLNPPDVSLGACASSLSRNVPDNVPTQRDESYQAIRLQDQLQSVQRQNQQLESQLRELRMQNQHLQEELLQRESEAQARRDNERRSSGNRFEAGASANSDQERNEVWRQKFDELSETMDRKCESIRDEVRQDVSRMEQQLHSQIDRNLERMTHSLTSTLQREIDRRSHPPEASSESPQFNNIDHASNNAVLQLQNEFQNSLEEQRRMLERERTQQMVSLSRALQSAFQQLGDSLSNNKGVDSNNAHGSQS